MGNWHASSDSHVDSPSTACNVHQGYLSMSHINTKGEELGL